MNHACILSTDMGKHMHMLARFKDKRTPSLATPFKTSSQSDREFLLGMVVHACDIGNPCLEFQNYKNWASLIVQEFHDETVLEAKDNLPVTGFKKWSSYPGFLGGQIFFLGFFTLGTWTEVEKLLPGMKFLTESCKSNLTRLKEEMMAIKTKAAKEKEKEKEKEAKKEASEQQ